MSYDAFLYELRDTMIGEKTLRFHVRIGYFEPRRWKKQDGSYSPGMAFAAYTEVEVEDKDKGLWNDEGESEGRVMEIKVAQTGNSLVSIEEAEERHEVNVQALQLAHFIQDQLDAGVGLAPLYDFLTEILTPDLPVPTDQPFRYTRKVFCALTTFSHDEVVRCLV